MRSAKLDERQPVIADQHFAAQYIYNQPQEISLSQRQTLLKDHIFSVLQASSEKGGDYCSHLAFSVLHYFRLAQFHSLYMLLSPTLTWNLMYKTSILVTAPSTKL